MDTVQTTTARPHIVWLDVLRLVAILMVIAIHCTDPFNASPESRPIRSLILGVCLWLYAACQRAVFL